MKIAKLLPSLPGALLVMVLAVLALVYMPASANTASTSYPYPYPGPTQTPAGSIAGSALLPNSYPAPEGTQVRLFDQDGKTLRASVSAQVNGAYAISPVANGSYQVKAVAPAASNYLDSLPRDVTVLNNNLTGVNLRLGIAQAVGVVHAPGGSLPAAAEIVLTTLNGAPVQKIRTENGEFKLGGLAPGAYFLEAFPVSDDPYWKSEKHALTISNAGGAQRVTLTLTPAQVWGWVVTSQDKPVAQAVVSAGMRGGANGGMPRRDLTSASGYFAIGGLPASGEFSLFAVPPAPTPPGMQPSEVVTVTLPQARNPYLLTLAIPRKTVTGLVTTHTGQPVPDAQISARRVGSGAQLLAASGADGAYELDLTAGLWSLTVQPAAETANWVYQGAPQLVSFAFTRADETQTQNFTVLAADALVGGQVFMPDGVNAPPFTVTIGLHNDEGVGRVIKILPGQGSFQAAIPSGSYKVDIFAQNPGYTAPRLAPVTIPANGAYASLNVTLLARGSAIRGVVRANGQGAAGIAVIAWQAETPGSLRTLTQADGSYLFNLAAGSWHIQPAPAHGQPYLYSGSGADVALPANQVISGVDFVLDPAQAVIQGVLVDEQNQPIDESGWARARLQTKPEIQTGAPVVGGAFQIAAPADPAGSAYLVSVILPPSSPYIAAAGQVVSAFPGQTSPVTITLQKKSAVISGILYDPRSGQPVSAAGGKVSAWNGAEWAAAPVDAAGAFRLEVSAGLWRLSYALDPASDYVRLMEAHSVALENGQTVFVQLPVTRKDAAISGIVYAPDGSPLASAPVWVKGLGGLVENIWLQTTSDEQGAYTLALPHGSYRLGAAYNSADWIAPRDQDVQIGPNQTLSGQDLRFSAPSLTISGRVTIPGALTAGPGSQAHVSAWSDQGGFVSARVPLARADGALSGAYSLSVTGGATWHINAAYQEQNAFWQAKAEIRVGSASAFQDLTLQGPQNLPAPVAVTFDPGQAQFITLADGASIAIPAGALPAEGLVTLHIVPIPTLPQQKHASLLRYGYAFLATDASGKPIEQHFNQELAITFTYSPAELAAGRLKEAELKPAYFSTTTNRWTFPESFVVDPLNHSVTMQIDHFTDFALTGFPNFPVYFPLIRR